MPAKVTTPKQYVQEEIEEFKYADITYTATTVYKPKAITNKLPKLPFLMWQKIVHFLCHISGKHNSESILSLTVVDGKWKIIVWHQTTSGTLDVDYNPVSDENLALLDEETALALKTVHCTIHSHNKIGAHQSSTDFNDEIGREGWHITIGHCDKPVTDVHCRFNCRNLAEWDTDGKKIKDTYQEFVETGIHVIVEQPKIPAHLKGLKSTCQKSIMQGNHQVKYPEEWNERVKKKVYTPATVWPGYQPRNNGINTAPGKNTKASASSTCTKNKTLSDKQAERAAKHLAKEEYIEFDNLAVKPIKLFNPAWVMIQLLYQDYGSEPMAEDCRAGDDRLYTCNLEISIESAMLQAMRFLVEEQGIEAKSAARAYPDIDDMESVIVATYDKYVSIHPDVATDTTTFNQILCEQALLSLEDELVFKPLTRAQ